MKGLRTWAIALAAVLSAAASGAQTDVVTRRLLEWQSRAALERRDSALAQHMLLVPFEGGLAADLVLQMTRHAFRTDADARAWMRRLERYPAALATARAKLSAGMDHRVTTPRALVERSLEQWERLAAGEARTSTLWAPAQNFSAPMRERYERLLDGKVLPAMRTFAAFVRDDYLPRARATDGLGAVPGGERLYRMLVRQETEAKATPESIHQLGESEVRRIQLQVMLAAGQAGYKGELRDLRTWLRTDPENFPFRTPADVLAKLQAIHARIVPGLPLLFATLPRAPYEISLEDVFAGPVADATEISRVSLASMVAREAMPGRALERALARERPLPAFRRELLVRAYAEGWALYAEGLGHEIGLYDEPLALVGRYLDELHHAARLVADTGLHAGGWTRERTVEFLVEEAALPERAAVQEVLRLMAWPAHALGPKYGEIVLRGLRGDAQRRLGERFDVRVFHERVLSQGQLPLDLLRGRVDAWISSRPETAKARSGRSVSRGAPALRRSRGGSRARRWWGGR
ncbi:MAG TPA: DUF885 domain-containing protein [Usitatibacter sp.]|nr:DUF885 domain-containing protein [Usitatibacter sp.]